MCINAFNEQVQWNAVALIKYSRNILLPGNIPERSLAAVSSRAPLSLSGLPVVSISSSTDKIQEGGNLTFECHVTGSPTPNVRWQTEKLKSPFVTQVL